MVVGQHDKFLHPFRGQDDTNSRAPHRNVVEDYMAEEADAWQKWAMDNQGPMGDAVNGGAIWDGYVYPHPTTPMALRVAPISALPNPSLTHVNQQDIAALTAPVTNPRIDLVVADATTGVATVVTGTENVAPVAPALPGGKLALVTVYLRVGATTIDAFGRNLGTNSYILRDFRHTWAAPVIAPFQFPGDITPTALAADVNDYAPTGLSGATTLRLSATGATRTITGLTGGLPDRVIVIHNVGTQNIVLSDANVLSSATNRFEFPSGSVTIIPKGVAFLEYDGTNGRWHIAGGSAVSAGGAAGGDLGGSFPNPTVLQASGAFAFTGDIAATIAADTDNWAPTGLATAGVIQITATGASRNLNGLTGGSDGRMLWLENVGAQNVVLKDEAGSSTAANRFALPADVTLTPDSLAIIKYDAGTSRWRVVAGGGGAGIAIKNNGTLVTARSFLNFAGTGFVFTDDGTNTIITFGATPTGQNLGSGSVVLTSGNLTTTSTSFVDATGLTATLTTVGGAVRVSAQALVDSTASQAVFDIVRDGVSQGGPTGGVWYQNPGASAEFVTNWVDPAPVAGSHTYKLQWKTQSAGTLHLYADGTNYKAFLDVREESRTTLVGTGGGTPLASGNVTVGSGNITTTSTTYVDTTGVTSTITPSGGDVQVVCQWTSSMSVTNDYIQFDILRDGVSLSGATAGFLNIGNIPTSHSLSEPGYFLDPAPSAASHTYKIQWKVGSGTGTISADGTARKARFHVHELPQTNTLVQAGAALGSGTVTLSGADLTTTSTSFVDVTGMSLSFTSQGGKLAIIANVDVFNSVAATLTGFDLLLDGVSLSGGLTYGVAVTRTNNDQSVHPHLIVSAAAGSHTAKAQWKAAANTSTMRSTTTGMVADLIVQEQPFTTLGGVVGTGAVLGTGSVTLSSGNVTTTSTTYVDVTGMTATITTVGGPVRISSTAVWANSGSNTNELDLLRDGTSLSGGMVFGMYGAYGASGAGGLLPLSLNHLDVSPTAASHTWKAQWKVTAGTATLHADGSNAKVFYSVREEPNTTGGPRTDVSGHLAGNTVATGVTQYACPGLSTLDNTEANREGLFSFTGVVRNFYVRTSTSQSAGGTLVLTLRVNGADTGVVITIGISAAAGTYNSGSTQVAVSAGDRYSWKVTNNGSSTSAALQGLAMEHAG